MQGRKGRPQKPYITSWNEAIQGLTRCADGRWRVQATEQRFSEPDERRAVERFFHLTGGRSVTKTTAVEIKLSDLLPDAPGHLDDLTDAHADKLTHFYEAAGELDETGEFTDGQLPDASLRLNVPDAILWTWLRHQLANNAEEIGRKVGIPDLAARLEGSSLRTQSIKLSQIIDTYQTHNPSTKRAKDAAVAKLQMLIDHAAAKTLDDLTHAKLLAFKTSIEKSAREPATKQFIYSRIKLIISFGLKMGLDEKQIRSALDRCKVLWTGEAMPTVQPNPIHRDHLHKLLATGNGTWRAWILVGLNLCLHMDEVCGLKWSEIDMKKGTYACVRNKTRKQRIPRAATLWPETIEAIKALPRKGPEYVFTSSHGTRFSRNSRVNDFKELRIKAGLPEDVTFDTLRDGAYTAAVNDPTVEERFARVMAGHRSPGLQDSYVLRSPEICKGACLAVYRAYGPF